MLTTFYRSTKWKEKVPRYIRRIVGVDNFMSLAGFNNLPGGLEQDLFGCIWKRESMDYLVVQPLKKGIHVW